MFYNNKSRQCIKIASILDEFSYECFKYECNLIQLNHKDWESILIREQPDLLLVESAWNGDFKRLFNKVRYGCESTVDLIEWCRHNKIPTVFWNKEDPFHFGHFINIAKCFDYIFTTDSDCIPEYIKTAGHSNVYLLPFAAQPKIHNPIGKEDERLGSVAFSGTWYLKRSARKKDIKMLFDNALGYNLHIYDRKYETENSNYMFPDIYKPYVRGYLPYEQMVSAYKKYDVFLNVNTVKNSPTMFSRRVFELLACGTGVISNYSLGIEKMLPGIVNLCKKDEDVAEHLENLLGNKFHRDKISLIGQREVFNNHTYNIRLNEILDRTGIGYQKEEPKGVSVTAYADSISSFNNTLENFQRQKYKNKELIVLLDSNKLNFRDCRKRVRQFENVRVFRAKTRKPFGNNLNFAVKKSEFDYISIFDKDSFYSYEYVGDLMNVFKYADTGVVGKCSFYTYCNKSKLLKLIFPGMEYRYTDQLCGTAFIAQKDVFYRMVTYGRPIIGSKDFFNKCSGNGIRLYSSDRFNFIQGFNLLKQGCKLDLSNYSF